MAIIPLELHSHLSFLQATASPQALVNRAADEGLSHLALTDTAGLYGAVAFNQACQQAQIQPIIGLTVYIRPDSPTDLPGKLTLLATNPTGYTSLCRISSRLQSDGQREVWLAHGLDWSVIAENTAGLVCLSGGRYGALNQALLADREDQARVVAERLAQTFAEQAYLSLEIHTQADHNITPIITEFAAQLGLGTIAVQPVYTLSPKETKRLKLLAAINQNCPLEAVPPTALPHHSNEHVTLHWRDQADLQDHFAAWPEAIANVMSIIAQCKPALPDGQPIWPILPLPPEQTPEEKLRQQTQQGLQSRYTEPDQDDLTQRLETELMLIGQLDYAPLFLIVADIVRFARESGVPVSTRGSVANSLVAYCLGITTVDPIAHNLLFERFLNPARSDPPDIDLDFCSRRRDQVLAYVRETYGQDQVALVGTISTMQPKSAIREVGKAYELSDEAIKRLGKLMPRHWHPDPRRRDQADMDTVLQSTQHPVERTVIQQAFAVIGQPHHLSLHPGGLVITPGPLTDVVPVQLSPKGYLATQYDHGDVEKLGLQKIDLLGISALTVLADAADLIRAEYRPDFQLDEIPETDLQTGDQLQQGDTVGVFQCESTGARATLLKLKAQTVADLAIANAFFKPGPATGGMADNFVRRYRGQEAVAYLHPALAPILAESKGVLLFQEQVLRVATEIAGLSWAEADFIRRGISKFRDDQVQQVRGSFVQGCLRINGPGLSKKQAETLWEQISAFSGYGFNKGHATAYAALSYQMAYLKTHYPAPFLAARLQTHGGFHHPAIYIAEARRLGLSVRPPHINHSERRFRLQSDRSAPEHNKHCETLWMGLRQVRDLRRASVSAIIEAREQSPFTSLRDLLQRVPLQTKEIEHLIKAGALDGLDDHRASLLVDMGDIERAGNAQQLGFDFGRPTVEPETKTDRLHWERDLLGLPISVNPLDAIPEAIATATSFATVSAEPETSHTMACYRMPGWTGGKGFFISDGQDFMVAQAPDGLQLPEHWQGMIVQGQFRPVRDGVPWLQIRAIET